MPPVFGMISMSSGENAFRSKTEMENQGDCHAFPSSTERERISVRPESFATPQLWWPRFWRLTDFNKALQANWLQPSSVQGICGSSREDQTSGKQVIGRSTLEASLVEGVRPAKSVLSVKACARHEFARASSAPWRL
jgi:hypothetical protein